MEVVNQRPAPHSTSISAGSIRTMPCGAVTMWPVAFGTPPRVPAPAIETGPWSPTASANASTDLSNSSRVMSRARISPRSRKGEHVVRCTLRDAEGSCRDWRDVLGRKRCEGILAPIDHEPENMRGIRSRFSRPIPCSPLEAPRRRSKPRRSRGLPPVHVHQPLAHTESYTSNGCGSISCMKDVDDVERISICD